MSEKIRQKGQEFALFLQSLPEDERSRGNQINLDESRAQHNKFATKFREGICYLCNAPLASFEKSAPCAHWLLRPKGFGKNDFPAITKKYGFFQLQSYLRWIANEAGFARNINDLRDENSNKLFEVKYNNLEWAFSCAESDYLGHATTQHARHCHYHFQMRINGRMFIKYSDFHIAFKERDIISIEAMRALPELVSPKFICGEGMDELLQDDIVEHIVNSPLTDGIEEDAPIKIDTFVIADERTTISGEALYDLIQEAKAKKVKLASLMNKLPNARTQVIVSPGPGVIDQAPRSGRKKSNDQK